MLSPTYCGASDLLARRSRHSTVRLCRFESGWPGLTELVDRGLFVGVGAPGACNILPMGSTILIALIAACIPA
jgi:hypothetical protein